MTPGSPSQTAQQTHHPSMRVPHQHQVTLSKVADLWKLGPSTATGVPTVEETFKKFEAEGQIYRIS